MSHLKTLLFASSPSPSHYSPQLLLREEIVALGGSYRLPITNPANVFLGLPAVFLPGLDPVGLGLSLLCFGACPFLFKDECEF